MKKRHALLIILILAKTTALHAQEENRTVPRVEHSLSAHLGYSYLLDRVAGLSSFSEKYNNKLRSGFVWDLQFDVRVARFTGGVLFLSYASGGKTEHTSDNIMTNSLILQFGFYIVSPQKSRIAIKMIGGSGLTTYTNNSMVFGNKREIYENFLCGNVGLGGIYRLSSHIGLSADARLVLGERSNFDVYYHDDSFVVERKLLLHQFNISVGINYIF
ncbi:MAG: hypothetical protein LBF19_05115 [Prevotellaceae bacterium]|jgi:hypothetical protein|nr:hypothetical protein [Prevotellaceae bacterium]